MPASDTREQRRGGRLLTVLFWAGVGLAPVAALVLLMSQSEGPLRVAAVLTVLAVVLIGLSITLRRESETVRLDLEETLLDELDTFREDVRQDIASAARATHKAFGERVQLLNETVDALRAELQAVRAGTDRADGVAGVGPHAAPAASAMTQVGHPLHQHVGHHPAESGPVGAAPGRARVPTGIVRHTETVQVTTRHTIVGPHGGDDPGHGTVYGGGNVYGDRRPSRPAAADWPSGPMPAAQPTEASQAPPVVAQAAPRARRVAEPAEESWTERRLRERLGDRANEAPPDRLPDRNGDPGADERWSEMRAGDRWAAVRSDERGSELRMGERRAAVHAVESGTELRIEDRWAAVRREESYPRGRRDGAPPSWDVDIPSGWRGDDQARWHGGAEQGWDGGAEQGRDGGAGHGWDGGAEHGWDGGAEHGWHGGAEHGWGDRQPGWSPDDRVGGRDRGSRNEAQWSSRDAPAALPAGAGEASEAWDADRWSEPDPEPAWRGGHPYRDDHGYGHHSTAPDGDRRRRARGVDFERTDERWR